MKSVPLSVVYNQAKQDGIVALDTEFDRRSTYFPMLSLMQFCTTKEEICIIDIMENNKQEREMIASLLSDPGIIKVFHSFRQDIEAIRYNFNIMPVNIMDTQILASLMGHGSQVSYGDLVHNLIGLQLDKENQFSDWRNRPLSPSQLKYAALDVLYLLPIYNLMLEKLEDESDKEKLYELCANLMAQSEVEAASKKAWQKFKAYCILTRRIKKEDINLAKILFFFRENIAISRNRLRKWVIADDMLSDIAIKKPQTVADFQDIKVAHFVDKAAVCKIVAKHMAGEGNI